MKPRCESKIPSVAGMRCRLPVGHDGPHRWWNKTGEKTEWLLTPEEELTEKIEVPDGV